MMENRSIFEIDSVVEKATIPNDSANSKLFSDNEERLIKIEEVIGKLKIK